MFNTIKIRTLEERLRSKELDLDNLKFRVAELELEKVRVAGILKDLSLGLAEMTDTLNTIKTAVIKPLPASEDQSNAKSQQPSVSEKRKAPANRR